MTHYSYAQLMGLWINAGGSRAKAALAAAIAEAESSGESDATSPNPDGGTNVGPWQLDTRGKGAGYTVAQLKDPATNAKVAVAGSKNGTDWSAWETYVTGAYKRFMSGRTTPDTGVPSPKGSDTATVAAYSPAECLWSFPGIPVPLIGNLGQFCVLSKSNARAWIGAAVLTAGGLLMLPGIALIAVAAGTKTLGAAAPILEKTGAAVALVPGAEVAGVAIAGAGRAGRSSAEATQRRRAQRAARGERADAAQRRALGEPRENPELRTGRGAVRESPEGSRERARRYAGASSGSSGSSADRPPF